MTRLNLLLLALSALVLSLGAFGLGARMAKAGDEAVDAPGRIGVRTDEVALVVGSGVPSLAGQIREKEAAKDELLGEVGAGIEAMVALAVLAKGPEATQPPAKEQWETWNRETATAWLASLQAQAEGVLKSVKEQALGASGEWQADEGELARSLRNFIMPRSADSPLAIRMKDAGGDGATGANPVDFRWVEGGDAASGKGFWFSADEMVNAPVDESELAAPKQWSGVPGPDAGGLEWLSLTLTCRMPQVAEWLAAHAAGELQNMDAGYGEWVLDGADKKVIGRATMPPGLQYTDEGIWLQPLALEGRIGAPQAGTKGPQFASPDQVLKYLSDHRLWQDPELRKFGFTNNPAADGQLANARWREIGAWITRRVEAQAQMKAPKEDARDFRYRWLLPADGIAIKVTLSSGAEASNGGGGA